MLNVPKWWDGASFKTLSTLWVSTERPEFALHGGFKKGKILWRSTLLLISSFMIAAGSRWGAEMLLWGPGEPQVPKGPGHQHPGGVPQLTRCACGEEQFWKYTSISRWINKFSNSNKHLFYKILWEGGRLFSRGYFQLKNAFPSKISDGHFPLHLWIFCHKVLSQKYDTLGLQKMSRFENFR